MEIINTKNKKRKTRKCLDEIRKRSRSVSYDGQVASSKIEPDKNCKSRACSKLPNLITTERITLAMFPKAITSETITRPALEKVILGHNIFAMAKNKSTNENIASNPNTVKLCYHQEISDSERANNLINEHNSLAKDKSLSSGVTRSPSLNSMCSVNGNVSSESEELDLFKESDVSLSLRRKHEYQVFTNEFYENFMNGIPSFLKKNVQGLFHHNPSNNLRQDLLNLLVDSCEEGNGDKILNNLKSETFGLKSNRIMSHSIVNTSDRIVENPMDYIRLGCGWRRDSLQGNSTPESSSPVVPPSMGKHSPLIHSSPLMNILQETPEYKYYPHKLNQ